MDNLLPFFIFTLLGVLVGMRIVLRIIQSLPFMGMGMSYPTHTQPVITGSVQAAAPDKKGGFSSFLLFIVLTFMLWMLFINSQEVVVTTDELPTPEAEYVQTKQESYNIAPATGQTTTSKTDMSSKRINQSPTSDQVDGSYAIQIVAVSSLENAEQMANTISSHEPYIIQENGLYKVIITGFQTATSAKEYKEYYDLEGFARTV